MNIIIQHKQTVTKVCDGDSISIIGGFWHKEQYYTGEAACDFLCANICTDDINGEKCASLVRSLNGSFMFCIESPSFVLAAVDKVRSIPLYYTEESITDSIRPGGMLDPTGCNELLSSGYTVGSRTVYADWHALEPGELLLLMLKHTEKMQIIEYYNHLHHIQEQLDEDEIEQRFVTVSERVIGRTLQSLKGKNVMIALSGGFDSRYIACMLKDYGVKRVVAYTYGKSSSYEVETSRTVAKKLGYEWNFIEYTDEVWEQIVQGSIVDDFMSYSFTGDGVPCFQEIPALWTLSKKYNPEEYCILPGYCGDLFGGSYLLPQESTYRSINELAQFLYNRHFGFRRNKFSERKLILSDLSNSIGGQEPLSYDKAASLNENWFVNHKVAKFVVHAVQMFEFFGYEWRLPLWDDELLDLWYSVPLSLRGLKKNLYRELLFKVFFSKYNINMSKPASFSKKQSTGIAQNLKYAIKKANSFLDVNMGVHFLPQFDVNNFAFLERFFLSSVSDRRRYNYGHLNSNAFVARRVIEEIEKAN